MGICTVKVTQQAFGRTGVVPKVQIESRRSEGPALHPDGVRDVLLAGDRALGEFQCADCGYGVSVRRVLPQCPMCRGSQWEEPATTARGSYG